MEYKRAALLLAVAGLLFLPGVGYVFALDSYGEPEPHRSAASYGATQIDVDNDTVMAEQYRSTVTFYVPRLQYRHVEDEFDARNESREVLLQAMETGRATTTDEAVRSDLRSIQRNYSFVTEEHDEVYRLTLERDGARTVVTATPANRSAVADAARDEVVVEYESLSPGERATVEKILNASRSEDAYGYRPWSNESMPDPPVVVEKGDTYYAVETVAHVDDFDLPDGLLLGLAASGLGVVLLVAALLVALVGAYRSRRGGDATE